MLSRETLPYDLKSGLVVFLVALPLCLGIALGSGAPAITGLIAGIVGGLVVAAVSGSHTSVSGPAAGLTAIVSAQIMDLGFDGFLLAVLIAGVLQIVLGVIRAGTLSAFFPSSVIKGLLAAIGVILILKQIPHLFGKDIDLEGNLAFETHAEPVSEASEHASEASEHGHNTFSEILTLFEGELHTGAIVVGLVTLVVLVLWGQSAKLKNSFVPGPLVVVLVGVGINLGLLQIGGGWGIEGNHLVKIPTGETWSDMLSFFQMPDFSRWNEQAIYVAGVTIAIVASLETLLNLEAVDKLDPQRRNSPASRELIAQGCGNMVCGMIGGLPVTSVIVRGSVNVTSGAKTKFSAIFHGVLLVIAIALLPTYMNMIPKAALAAILIVTGLKLASPKLFKQMWDEGFSQLVPFVVTLVAIVMTDLLIGIIIGLALSAVFILYNSFRGTVRRAVATKLGEDVLHIELASQVTFLNRAALSKIMEDAPAGSHLLIDATDTEFIDPDILSLIREFKETTAEVHGVIVSLRGFRPEHKLENEIHFDDHSTEQFRDQLTPELVLDLLREGNRRFQTGDRLSRDYSRQIGATAMQQTPMAVVLSCIDSRVPVELVFDLGIGDVFSVRVAGNVLGTRALGGIEYGVAVAGVKLVLVLGHTRCGAVTESLRLIGKKQNVVEATSCEHLQSIVEEIQGCCEQGEPVLTGNQEEDDAVIDDIARRNVLRTVDAITERSAPVRAAAGEGRVMVVGALYDVSTGKIEFLSAEPVAG